MRGAAPKLPSRLREGRPKDPLLLVAGAPQKLPSRLREGLGEGLLLPPTQDLIRYDAAFAPLREKSLHLTREPKISADSTAQNRGAPIPRQLSSTPTASRASSVRLSMHSF